MSRPREQTPTECKEGAEAARKSDAFIEFLEQNACTGALPRDLWGRPHHLGERLTSGGFERVKKMWETRVWPGIKKEMEEQNNPGECRGQKRTAQHLSSGDIVE